VVPTKSGPWRNSDEQPTYPLRYVSESHTWRCAVRLQSPGGDLGERGQSAAGGGRGVGFAINGNAQGCTYFFLLHPSRRPHPVSLIPTQPTATSNPIDTPYWTQLPDHPSDEPELEHRFLSALTLATRHSLNRTIRPEGSNPQYQGTRCIARACGKQFVI
jgi:hypothetical protein